MNQNEAKLVKIVAELFNAVADLAEGGQWMAGQRLNAIAPDLKTLMEEVEKTQG